MTCCAVDSRLRMRCRGRLGPAAKRGSRGLPQIDFTLGACTFCGECVTRCRSGALDRSTTEGGQPWTLVARINESCLAGNGVECRVCGEQCDARAIHFERARRAPAQPMITPEECTGCGACVAPCPVGAIDCVTTANAYVGVS